MNRKNGHPLISPMREPLMRTDDRVYCTERGEFCDGCPYPRHGFICWFDDGTCLKTVVNKHGKKGVKLCPA